MKNSDQVENKKQPENKAPENNVGSKKPTDYARKWSFTAFVIASVFMAKESLSSQGDTIEKAAVGVVTVLIPTAIAYAAGWIYGKKQFHAATRPRRQLPRSVKSHL